MVLINASQERGWIAQFPETTVAGKWRWSLVGPMPQVVEEDEGTGAHFEIDEKVPGVEGEYAVSLQRLDSNGAPLGDSQVSASFRISIDKPPVLIEIEVAGPVSVALSKS